MSAGLRSGQLAAAAGVNVQTLRYYERRGILPEPGRSLGGHRLYPERSVAVLRVIKAAQRLGFSLDEVADLLAATHPRAARHAQAGLRERARAELAEVDAKLAELHAVRDTLAAAITAGCEDLLACSETPCCPIPFTGAPTGDGGEGSVTAGGRCGC